MRKNNLAQAVNLICEVAQRLNDEDQNDLWFKLNKAVAIIDQARKNIGGML